MTSKPSSSSPLLLRLIARAAEHSAQRNPDSTMQAVAERARKIAAKAMREDKAGPVTDGETTVIVEK